MKLRGVLSLNQPTSMLNKFTQDSMSAHERPVSAELCCECYVCYVIKYGSHIGGTHLPTCLSSVSLPVSMAKPGSSVATRRSACERERERTTSVLHFALLLLQCCSVDGGGNCRRGYLGLAIEGAVTRPGCASKVQGQG